MPDDPVIPTPGTFTDLLRLLGHDDQLIVDLQYAGVHTSVAANTALTAEQIAAIEAAYAAEIERE